MPSCLSHSVWKQACDPTSFEKVNGRLLADELAGEVAKAKAEWDKIDQDLLMVSRIEPIPSSSRLSLTLKRESMRMARSRAAAS